MVRRGEALADFFVHGLELPEEGVPVVREHVHGFPERQTLTTFPRFLGPSASGEPNVRPLPSSL